MNSEHRRHRYLYETALLCVKLDLSTLLIAYSQDMANSMYGLLYLLYIIPFDPVLIQIVLSIYPHIQIAKPVRNIKYNSERIHWEYHKHDSF